MHHRNLKKKFPISIFHQRENKIMKKILSLKIVGDAFDGSNWSTSLQHFCQLYHAAGARSEELYQTYKSANTGSISDKIFMAKNKELNVHLGR